MNVLLTAFLIIKFRILIVLEYSKMFIFNQLIFFYTILLYIFAYCEKGGINTQGLPVFHEALGGQTNEASMAGPVVELLLNSLSVLIVLSLETFIRRTFRNLFFFPCDVGCWKRWYIKGKNLLCNDCITLMI